MTVSPVTLEEAKAFLNLDADDTGEDAELTEMLSAAAALVEARCGAMEERSVTERVWTRDSTLILSDGPVLSVESVTAVSGSVAVDLTLLDVDLDAGQINGVGGWCASPTAFDFGRTAFVVEYTVGRDPVPAELKQVVKIVAEQMFKTQRGTDDEEPVYKGFIWPARAIEEAAPFRRIAVA